MLFRNGVTVGAISHFLLHSMFKRAGICLLFTLYEVLIFEMIKHEGKAAEIYQLLFYDLFVIEGGPWEIL
ncbi:MAG: hypothetical protein DBX44_08235 [Oscillospiraceae bacterium]|nr:MAG: hypothetical protein DBX44_08235 [Oscillospiraceae bacterium]